MAGTSEGAKKAAQTRSENANRNNEGKDPSRVEAGRKAAQTRGHESLSEAGRKGGERSHGGRRQEE